MNKKEVFKKNVKKYFDFLVNDHGFKEIEISADILSYGAGISLKGCWVICWHQMDQSGAMRCIKIYPCNKSSLIFVRSFRPNM